MCTADRDGLLVSLIQSNFSGAGSGLRVDEWGINLHNRGSAFLLDDAHPNGIGPGKMPLHTLIPALALRDGQPWLVFGSEGGHGQAQTHLQVLDAHARRRRRSAGGDQRAALHDRSRSRGASRSRTTSTPAWIDDLRARGHEIDVVPRLPPRPGHRARDRVHRPAATAPAPTHAPKGGTAGL